MPQTNLICAAGRILFIPPHMEQPSRKQPLWSHLSPPRAVLYLLCCYLVGVVFFAAYRAAFLVQFRDAMPEATAVDFLKSFLIGWRFDQIVTLWILLPLTLTILWLDLRTRLVRILAISYLSLVFSAVTILLLADLRFFKYLHTHLNFQAVQYVSEGGRTTWHLIVTEPRFVLSLCLWAVATIALLFLFMHLMRLTNRSPERTGPLRLGAWFVVCAGIDSFWGYAVEPASPLLTGGLHTSPIIII